MEIVQRNNSALHDDGAGIDVSLCTLHCHSYMMHKAVQLCLMHALHARDVCWTRVIFFSMKKV